MYPPVLREYHSYVSFSVLLNFKLFLIFFQLGKRTPYLLSGAPTHEHP